MTSLIREQKPFVYIRYGDGAFECIKNTRGQTADGEHYSLPLAIALQSAWYKLCVPSPNPVFIGDWLSATFQEGDRVYEKEWIALRDMAIRCGAKLLHWESLLFHRLNPVDLMRFYSAIQEDTRDKLLIAPVEMAPAAKQLGMMHLVTPMDGLFPKIDEIEKQLDELDFKVCLFGAGMAVNVPILKHWSRHRDRTFVAIGSALDPIFRRKSRTQQIPKELAREMWFTRLRWVG